MISEREPAAGRQYGPAVGIPDGVRAVPLDGSDSGEGQGPAERSTLAEQLRTSGLPHRDMRDWLQMVDAIGELKVLEGVDWQENIGRITEMLHHTDGAPAVLFDRIPDYPPGYRILVNAQGERRRLAVSLGLPVDIGVFELMDEWERRMDSVKPVPHSMVDGGPITENVFEGDQIDLWKFPTPKWHEQDGAWRSPSPGLRRGSAAAWGTTGCATGWG